MITGKIYNLYNKTFSPIDFTVSGKAQLSILIGKLLAHYKFRLRAVLPPQDLNGNVYDVVYKHTDNDKLVIGIIYGENNASPQLQAGVA